MKAIKIVIGVILLGFSAFYLLGIVVSLDDVKSTVSYSADSYLQVEFLDSENVGDAVETEWGRELSADPGYDYYRLSFRIENLSSREYYGVPAQAVSIDGVEYDDVQWGTEYEGKDVDYEQLFYESAQPSLPGKTETTAVLYVQVKEGVDMVIASYTPSWKVEEATVLDIPLN